MLMSKAIIVFLFIFIVKTSSAFIKKSRRQVSYDYNHECGTHSSTNGLLYNGKFVHKGLFPWKVALAHTSTHMFYPGEHFCGGVIISKTFVITAAHCLHPKYHDRTKDADIVLRFGAHELKVTRESGAISEPLLKSYIHEDWNPELEKFDADIALLEIENPLTFSNLIKPICLWTGDIAVDSLNKNFGTVVFWRKTSDVEYSYDPLQMSADIVDNEKCFFDHNELLRISSNRTFCASPRDGKTTPCKGDSGSGLYLKNNRKHYLKGLVSAIWERCDPTTYTVYTDVFKYTKWIKFTANMARTEPNHRSSGLSPWKVALIFSSNHRTHPSEYFCGGVIISQTFVISAAHCLHPKDHDRTKDTDIVLRFGADDLDIINEPRSISKPLKKSYIHDDWNSNSNIYDADIALLEIENPLTFSNFIKPINLWTGDNTLYETEGTVFGWGMNHLKNQSSNKPVELIVPVVNNEKCWMDHRELFTISSHRTFCGGSRYGISTLGRGSSGSGLYVENQNKYYLKGLVSAIWNSYDASAYTVYTNVFMFTDWIKKKANIL